VTTHPDAAEAVAMRLLDLGARGAATTEHGDRAIVTVHVPDSPGALCASAVRSIVEAVDAAFGLEQPSLIERSSVDDTPWQEAYRQHFKPFRLGRRLVVKPSWEPFQPAAEDVVLEIDPQMAFGTGLHPTTQLCLRALEGWVRPGHIVADIGAGSGILAIAAAKLGAAHVDAVDNDSVAVETTRRNVEANGVSERVAATLGSGIPQVTNHYDMIVANITGPVIAASSQDAARAVRRGGLYLVSGFTARGEEAVRRSLAQAGFFVLSRESQDEWLCLHCAKRSQK
jgi:ribosomal protein L11 methyltransferase